MKTKIHGGAIVDVGNVIIDHVTAGTTHEKIRDEGWGFYQTIPIQPAALEALSYMNDIFGGNVTLVYNATDTVDKLILDWLDEHRLTERTGIGIGRVHRTTHGRDKSPFMNHESATHYGTTVIVDDRLEVMRFFMDKDVTHLLLFKPQIDREIDELRKRGIWDFVQPALHAAHEVQSWSEIIETLRE